MSFTHSPRFLLTASDPSSPKSLVMVVSSSSLQLVLSRLVQVHRGALNPLRLFDGLEYLSSELRILFWARCPLQSLASVISLENLQILEMRESQIEYLWEGKKQLKSLKHIYLSHSLNLCKTPDLCGCPNLEILDFEGCIQLYEVDSSVGFLERLTHLYLNGCKNLRLLPSSVSGLKSLKFLDLRDCSKLEKLPEDFGHLESLEFLYVNGTGLRELPSCMGLKNLIILSFSGCTAGTGPPISKLLPSSFAGLHSLTELNLWYRNLLEGDIPDNISCLSSLKKLYLADNQFVTVPESLSQLHRFGHLVLNHCPNLQRLPKLPSRVRVAARDCISLEIVPEHLSSAYFLNCLKLAKCTSVAFTSMKRHLQQALQYHRQVEKFEFVIPGNDIPEWFNHHSTGPLVTIDLPPGLQVKKCGVRIVYNHDEEEIMVNNVDPSTFSDILWPGEVAIVSGATTKRGHEHY
ncbi:hypothetical protein ACLB2K_007761 [Fragaria x ananassa]